MRQCTELWRTSDLDQVTEAQVTKLFFIKSLKKVPTVPSSWFSNLQGLRTETNFITRPSSFIYHWNFQSNLTLGAKFRPNSTPRPQCRLTSQVTDWIERLRPHRPDRPHCPPAVPAPARAAPAAPKLRCSARVPPPPHPTPPPPSRIRGPCHGPRRVPPLTAAAGRVEARAHAQPRAAPAGHRSGHALLGALRVSRGMPSTHAATDLRPLRTAERGENRPGWPAGRRAG